MLEQAAEAAEKAGVRVDWIQRDAVDFSLPQRFDAAICLCEGSLGLLGRSDDPIVQPLSVLCNISRSLKPQAKFIATVLSAARMFRLHSNEDVAAARFDPFSLTESSDCAPCEGGEQVTLREHGFVGTELRMLFGLAGFTVLHLWGGTAGRWGRRPLDLDEYEIMVVAVKTSEPLPEETKLRFERISN